MGFRLCPKCGGKVSDLRNDCPHCKYVFSITKICPSCEEQIDVSLAECPICGHPFIVLPINEQGVIAEETQNVKEKSTTFVEYNKGKRKNKRKTDSVDFSDEEQKGKNKPLIWLWISLGWTIFSYLVNMIISLDVGGNLRWMFKYVLEGYIAGFICMGVGIIGFITSLSLLFKNKDKKFIKAKIISIVLMVVLLCVTFSPVVFYTPFNYTKNSDGTYTLRYYDDYEATSVEIPSTYKGCQVTGIGDSAFYHRRLLTSVAIPDGVTSIGSSAFENCYSLTSIVIPDSVTSIGSYAFYGCSSLKYNVKDGLNYLGNDTNPYLYLVGAENKNLTTANIDDNCKFIGSYAFYYCDSLTSIEIPNSVTSIGDSAFYGCTSLKSITIGDSVESIGSSAFSNCSSLKYNEKDGLNYLGNDTNPYLYLVGAKNNNLTTANIDDNCKFICVRAFSNCSWLKEIEIPNSVTSIGDSAFYDCDSLTSIVIGDSVTSIGSSAFSNCTSLTSIVIPDSVTRIGNSAFNGCSWLTIYCEAESKPSGWAYLDRPVVWGYNG